MDLHSGTPLWRVVNPQPAEYPKLDCNATCEIAIVGGGITGALVAYYLVRAGADVILIDKRQFGAGSTSSSTGLLQYEIDTPLIDLIPKVGEAHAIHAYRRGIKAIDEMEALVGELGDTCGFARRPSLYFASSPEHVADLRREYECRRGYGFDVAFLNQGELSERYSVPKLGAILSPADGQIDPFQFTRCLLARCCAEGCAPMKKQPSSASCGRAACASFIPSRVRSTPGLSYLPQDTNHPATYRESVAYCTAFMRWRVNPLPRLKGWPDGSLIWETARPYAYARQTDDQRAIIGGEDTEYSTDHQRQDIFAQKARRLLDRVRQFFPAIRFVPAYIWAGVFGETKDGLAYIGKPPGTEREYFALDYGGNGITFGMIAARLLSDLLLGRPNEDAAVFRFDR